MLQVGLLDQPSTKKLKHLVSDLTDYDVLFSPSAFSALLSIVTIFDWFHGFILPCQIVN